MCVSRNTNDRFGLRAVILLFSSDDRLGLLSGRSLLSDRSSSPEGPPFQRADFVRILAKVATADSADSPDFHDCSVDRHRRSSQCESKNATCSPIPFADRFARPDNSYRVQRFLRDCPLASK